MAKLIPAIHVLAARSVKDADARDKPGRDGSGDQKRDSREKHQPHPNEARHQNAAQPYGQAPDLGINFCAELCFEPIDRCP
jgi:hypothetical protein